MDTLQDISLGALAEVHSLPNPAKFQSLENLFVKAASHILEYLPPITHH